MNSPLENREIRLRGLWPPVRSAGTATRIPTVDSSVAPGIRMRAGAARRSLGMTLRGAGCEAPRSLRGFPLFQPRVYPPGYEASVPASQPSDDDSSFCRRRRVIFACSPAATRSSASGSLSRRCVRIDSSSSAALARRADEVDVAEALLVRAVAVGQGAAGGVRGGVHPRLLARATSPARAPSAPPPPSSPRCADGCGTPAASPRGPAPTTPRPPRRRARRSLAKGRSAATRRAHSRDPQQVSSVRLRLRGGEGVQARQRRSRRRRSDARVPHSRSRATPPSGKMFSRTCVMGPIGRTSSSQRWRVWGCRSGSLQQRHPPARCRPSARSIVGAGRVDAFQRRAAGRVAHEEVRIQLDAVDGVRARPGG